MRWLDTVSDEKDELRSQFTASEPVVHQLANLVANSTKPLSHTTAPAATLASLSC